MERELRRCESNLSILGSGVIVLTIWEILKPLLLSLFAPETFEATTGSSEASEKIANYLAEHLSKGILAALVLLIFIMAILDIIVRIRIGRSARAEAAGKRRGKAYMILAFFLFAAQALGMIMVVANMIQSGILMSRPLESAATLLVEVSSVVIMGETAFTARKLKRLKKQMAG